MNKPLKKSEERALDELAKTSAFWSSVRAGYAQYDGLTLKQYDRLVETLERNAWKADAQRVAGAPVRNKFKTEHGEPRCGHRGKPFCPAAATVVVGSFGYCKDHAAATQRDLDDWLEARKHEQEEAAE